MCLKTRARAVMRTRVRKMANLIEHGSEGNGPIRRQTLRRRGARMKSRVSASAMVPTITTKQATHPKTVGTFPCSFHTLHKASSVECEMNTAMYTSLLMTYIGSSSLWMHVCMASSLIVDGFEVKQADEAYQPSCIISGLAISQSQLAASSPGYNTESIKIILKLCGVLLQCTFVCLAFISTDSQGGNALKESH